MVKFSIILLAFFQINFYSISINTIDGKQINLIQFQGKKVLIVNTASNSKFVSQYASLEQLYQKYKSTLVIIAIPSNDFNNELATSANIKNYLSSKFTISYILAEPQIVKDSNISPLYQWLTEALQNGAVENPVMGDFYKYLVDESGNITGVFNSSVDPMDSAIQNAIAN